MTNHTPGPWRVYDVTLKTPYVGTVSLNPKAGWEHQTICNLFEDQADNYDTQNDFVLLPNAEANGRLIAAAPDLLAALTDLYLVAREQLDQSATHDGLTNCEWLANAQAALIKASRT